METTELASAAPPEGAKSGRETFVTKWQYFAGQDLLRVTALATVCMCAALVFNQLREPPLPLTYVSKQSRLEQVVTRVVNSAGESAVSILPAAATSQVIDLAEFRELVQSKRAIVLDAQPEIFYRLGHVPGALSLSREAFEQDYAKQQSFLELRKDQPVAVYCSSASCEDSQMVADALVKLGYHQILIFKGGWSEWTEARLPEEQRQ